MAYGSTLIGVRVSGKAAGVPWSAWIKAVIYAAQRKDLGGAGSDVLTLEWVDDERVNRANRTGVRSELYGNGTNINHMLNRAIAFANRNGVLIVVSAGLWPAYGLPGDLRTEKSYVTNPCENANVLCVAASAPVGVCPPSHCAQNSINWFYCPLGLDFAGADYNRLAYFSSYGGALYIQKAAMDKGKLETELCAPGRTKTSVSAGQVKAAIVRGAVLPPGNPGEMRKIYGAGIINVPRTLGL
ncbi:hypothetical protein HYH03_014995 [Edaphochlamys debaryana]|uniref:Peptidase S8/S53 domain-containing protein n=1 Tax=Edaphochlamys debaryana TaxID=47281 RepID=A0A835XSV6_9CHLO|nr:hypothetical protein HYH03_014995 [Edaphochlamys debaryana]|eukprot:KAG2486290.1 hypothetical protein HYH03_014995 [Edaphochlamys debaryana]